MKWRKGDTVLAFNDTGTKLKDVGIVRDVTRKEIEVTWLMAERTTRYSLRSFIQHATRWQRWDPWELVV